MTIDSMRLKADDGLQRAEWMLALFVRTISVFFFLAGILAWLHLLGAPGFEPFETMPLVQQVIIGYFAVIRLFACVGLWLLSAWGAVIWLITVLAELLISLMFPQFSNGGILLIAFHGLAMATYLYLTWRVSQARAE